jgi:integral membrane protein
VDKRKLLINFQWVAIAEGVSYLALFFITMPLKYVFDLPVPNIYVGNTHGLLFLLYIGLAVLSAMKLRWSFKVTFLVLAASLLPFATFYMEKKFLRAEINRVS